MATLVELPVHAIREAVAKALPYFPQVAGAVLFGSALGSCRPDSDIDLGLILFPPCGEPPGWGFARLEADVERKLQPLGGHRFEVTVLSPDQPLFAFKAIREGQIVYIRDEDTVFDFVEKVSRSTAELLPRHQRALREVLQP